MTIDSQLNMDYGKLESIKYRLWQVTVNLIMIMTSNSQLNIGFQLN